MHSFQRSPVFRRLISRGLAAVLLLPAVFTCGCATLTPTDQGVLGGGAVGAGTGALIGHATGHTGAGAVIGGAVGALSGGLVGNAIEQSERRQEAKLTLATAPGPAAPGPLDVNGVVMLAQQHVSDEVIVSQIQTTGSVYRLNPNDIIYLKDNGVSDRVIQAMQQTATYAPVPRVYHPAPVHVYQPAPVYIMEPPPPPVRVGFGFGFSSCGRCR